ncbi:MAG: lamin tail domain-containing protein, partial [Solirubrobacteraceae bacterium]|nr:lamin tail domain-containing protein [Solirubrobacteraceae bacterium]
AGFLIGTYSGSGVGFGNGGDQVNVFDTTGAFLTGIAFGTGTAGRSFDNAAGLGSKTLPLPVVSRLSVNGENGAFVATGETGSPGTITTPVELRVTETSPWSSGNSSYGADWFEVTNVGAAAVNLTGYKVDDSSAAFGSALALNGISSIAPGESVIFIEGTATTAAAFAGFWFNDALTDPQIGTYSGGGIGLSTGGDEVNLFNALGERVTGIAFGSSTSGRTFDNGDAFGSATLPLPVISSLSVAGISGARTLGTETGSPGTIRQDRTDPTVTFVGALPTYTVDSIVNITCVAADEPRGSGLASTTCADVYRRGATYGVGTHQVSATAADFAGNGGSGSVSFEVIVTRDSLCTLMNRYVTWSAAYKALSPTDQLAFRVARVAPICRDELAKIRPGIDAGRRTTLISRFKTKTRQLKLDGYITHPQQLQLWDFVDQLPA